MKNSINISLALMALSTSACASSVKAPATAGRIIEYKSDASGFDTRTFFYEGENEVVAIDAQFTPVLARESIAYLRKFTDKPISWLIITHPNPDKLNGASVFKEAGAKLLASAATGQAIPGVHAYKEYFFVEMAKMFKRGEYPQPVSIDQTFTGKMELILRGGERLELRELAQPGVSSTQTVVYVKAAKALFVGDLIHNKAHAWLEGGIVNGQPQPTIDGWISDLNELNSLYPAEVMVYGGRGVPLELKVSVESQTAYLQIAVRLIDEQISELESKAQEDYKSLAAKFQLRFPDYEIPYMIEYGAYGLVQSEMQKRKAK